MESTFPLKHSKLYGHWSRVIAVFQLVVLPLLVLLPRLSMLVSMNTLDPTQHITLSSLRVEQLKGNTYAAS